GNPRRWTARVHPAGAAMTSLAGKRCLVTGGSRGLGRAMCEAFAAAGAKVAITFRTDTTDAEAARAALVALGAEPLVYQGNVADAAHVKHVVGEVTRAWGGIDVLVNNAGITQILPIALLEEADFDAVM